MTKLSKKQAEYVKQFLETQVEKLNKKRDDAILCHFCEERKHFKRDLGGFFAYAPYVNKENHDRGLIFDDFSVSWVCASCVERRGL